MSKNNKKIPKYKEPMNKVQMPVAHYDPDVYKSNSFQFTFNHKYWCSDDCEACKECARCNQGQCFSLFKLIEDPKEFLKVLKKLDGYRSQTWRQIEQADHTSTGIMEISLLDVKKMAFKHLADIKLDHEDLYKIEISGDDRLWGIREENIFYPLWYDNGHYFYKHKNKNW